MLPSTQNGGQLSSTVPSTTALAAPGGCTKTGLQQLRAERGFRALSSISDWAYTFSAWEGLDLLHGCGQKGLERSRNGAEEGHQGFATRWAELPHQLALVRLFAECHPHPGSPARAQLGAQRAAAPRACRMREPDQPQGCRKTLLTRSSTGHHQPQPNPAGPPASLQRLQFWS